MTKLEELQKQLRDLQKTRIPYEKQYKPLEEGKYREYTDEYKKYMDEERKLSDAVNVEYRAQEARVLSEIHIPKGLAYKLALHGFNEKCYRTYYKNRRDLKKPMRYLGRNYNENYAYSKEEVKEGRHDPYELCSPTYDQVALWFTEKYDVDFISSPEREREKKYRCDPITPEDGLINLPFSDTAKEAQLRAFEHLLTVLKPLPMKIKEEEEKRITAEIDESVEY